MSIYDLCLKYYRWQTPVLQKNIEHWISWLWIMTSYILFQHRQSLWLATLGPETKRPGGPGEPALPCAPGSPWWRSNQAERLKSLATYWSFFYRTGPWDKMLLTFGPEGPAMPGGPVKPLIPLWPWSPWKDHQWEMNNLDHHLFCFLSFFYLFTLSPNPRWPLWSPES